MRSAADLLRELRALDESHTIEAKRGSAVDRAVLETVCAFANEPGLGEGYLLLGAIAASQIELFGRSFEVVGVEDPDRVQSELVTQCRTAFNRPIRPWVEVEELEGQAVVIVRVTEAAPGDKPIYLKNLGLPRGAFRRVGPTDQEGTDDDLLVLYGDRALETYDATLLRDAELDDLDPREIAQYRVLRGQANPHAEELSWSDDDLLRALGAVARDGDGHWRPTVAGLLLFGTGPGLRRCFPMTRIDYIRVPGRRWVEDPDRRFDTVEIRAPLMTAVRRALAAVVDDMPVSFDLPEGQVTRSDEPLLPVRVLREALVNAVMHRSYRIHGPIQLLRYANRLEIRNPGHSLKAGEHLGEPGSETRNPRIAAVLHEVRMAETKGSGIRAMRELMQAKGLLSPAFESSRRPDQFVATLLFHHFLGVEDIAWLGRLTAQELNDEEARALVFVREVGAIDNATYRDINQAETLQASTHLRRLRDLELLEKKGSGNRTYYVPGQAFEAAAIDTEVPQSSAEVPQLPAEVPQLSAEVPQLPKELEERMEAAGRRPRRDRLRNLIVDLCAWRPLSAKELGVFLGDRDPRNLRREHLRGLVQEGLLRHTIPQMPHHPGQKYAVNADAEQS